MSSCGIITFSFYIIYNGVVCIHIHEAKPSHEADMHIAETLVLYVYRMVWYGYFIYSHLSHTQSSICAMLYKSIYMFAPVLC